jgi:hypothetical protein
MIILGAIVGPAKKQIELVEKLRQHGEKIKAVFMKREIL